MSKIDDFSINDIKITRCVHLIKQLEACRMLAKGKAVLLRQKSVFALGQESSTFHNASERAGSSSVSINRFLVVHHISRCFLIKIKAANTCAQMLKNILKESYLNFAARNCLQCKSVELHHWTGGRK